MSDQLGGWEIISKEAPKPTFWETIFGVLIGLGPLTSPPLIFTVRQKSTGYLKTVLAYNEGELPERIAKGAFYFERVISEDAAELIRTGLRTGGEAGALALNHVEYVFRHRLQKGDINPQELFNQLQDLLKPVNEEAAQEFAKRCSPLLPYHSAD